MLIYAKLGKDNIMAPEDYLRQYAESLQLSKVESGPASDGTHLMAGRGYYYPPYLQQEAYLDMLSRADLLKVMQQILATEYPQQRLIRRQVSEYLEALQRLKQERDWRQMEMERLESELSLRVGQVANLGDEISKIGAERERLDALVIDAHTELENCRSQIAILENESATLYSAQADLKASTSWKVTAPLRRVSGALKALMASGD
jgi:chromosome segregation ATPase